jgi:nicotinamide-nucleotide amidase
MDENNFYLSHRLVSELKRRQLTLTLVESCTGGGLAYQLSEVAGCSAVFERGFVVYSNAAKIEMLGVDPHVLEKYGAVSTETALEMAECAIKQCSASLSLSITGIAGPEGGSSQKPVGTVCFGMADRKTLAESRLCQFSSGRHQIRLDAIAFGLRWLLDYISNTENENECHN